jgi:hypothetical protein
MKGGKKRDFFWLIFKVGSNMLDVWEKIVKKAGKRTIKVGVVGVWTNAKVAFDFSTLSKISHKN